MLTKQASNLDIHSLVDVETFEGILNFQYKLNLKTLYKDYIKAIEYYYNTFRKLWGKYGFKDGFNLEGEKSWFAKEYIGIDKGIGMLMIENYLNETIWKYFMKNEYVIKGLEMLEFTDTKSEDLKLNKV